MPWVSSVNKAAISSKLSLSASLRRSSPLPNPILSVELISNSPSRLYSIPTWKRPPRAEASTAEKKNIIDTGLYAPN